MHTGGVDHVVPTTVSRNPRDHCEETDDEGPLSRERHDAVIASYSAAVVQRQDSHLVAPPCQTIGGVGRVDRRPTDIGGIDTRDE
jgi:hypothetical protein